MSRRAPSQGPEPSGGRRQRGRLLAAGIALFQTFSPLPPSSDLRAAPPPKASPDAELLDVTRRAEALLDKLEYERARELLESSVRNPQFRKARLTSKARLWALLGRARAELGDAVGTDEAFLQAVMWDRRVRLAKSTSPKILEALERARANAPLPGELHDPAQGPAGLTPGSPVAVPEDDPKARAEKPAPRAERLQRPEKAPLRRTPDAGVAVERQGSPSDTGRAPPVPRNAARSPDAGPPPGEKGGRSRDAGPATSERGSTPDRARPLGPQTPQEGAEKPMPEKPTPKQTAEKPAPEKKSAPEKGGEKPENVAAKEPERTPPDRASERPPEKGPMPMLRHRIEGDLKPGQTVLLVVEHGGLPKGAQLELEVRRAQSAGFKPEPLTRTASVALRRITMDRPRIELLVRAQKGKRLLAQIGSVEDPIVLTTAPIPPTLGEAWSSSETRPSLIATSTRAPGRESPGSSGLSPSSRPASATAATTTSSAHALDDETLLWLAIGGGAVLAAGIVVWVAVLASGSGNCDAPEGFGCTEIRVVPLAAF